MVIKVNVKSVLSKYASRHQQTFQLVENTKVADLEELVGMPHSIPTIVKVNNRIVPKSYYLQDSDEVVIIPIVGGG
jgi:sulfur carrier protein ThiS